jgi:hypothetical protein
MKINLNDYLESLSDGAVINCGSKSEISKIKLIIMALEDLFMKWQISHYNHGTHITKFEDFMSSKLQERDIKINERVFGEGIDCEILDARFNEWQKGKLQAKLVLEFIPDEPEITEPESPLDEIRREISQLQQ